MSDDASQTSDDAPPPWKVNNQKLPTRKTENTKEFSESSKRKGKKIRQEKIPLNKTKKGSLGCVCLADLPLWYNNQGGVHVMVRPPTPPFL